ncbi:single stranded DNA-binding protein [Bernardetia litoralis DSM 6794]|uniref:Single-stranded DNA-binding protein n=1 Tax=Bernardetia litoralis (strain ATCC 23117 / DSM 6794 / NBRC 15988 / NCIMB 1366 / Fx l1 / Sio-4) TaxID=880071 RepID=I4AKI7_BERLS|nr:single-stranded DNA-binding protein [Bernardetia litoralis]AFM04472.1 single stranded DNA-binding protein [Bernardetia litoralis DSM 6794]
MAGVNKVILLGNLGQDPEIRTLENGTKVSTISIATSENFKDQSGEWQERTEWHRVVLWRWNAEKAEKLKKGDKVYIEGKLSTRSWEQDGVKKYVTEVVANDLQFTAKMGDGNYNGGVPMPTQDPYAGTANTSTSSNTTTQPATEKTEVSADLSGSNNPEDDLPF